MKNKPIQQLVKRKDWQDLRKSFLGTWNKTPHNNVKTLRSWLGNIEITDNDKLRITLNYLTGSGFRSHTIHPSQHITTLLNTVKKEIKKRKSENKW